MLKAVFLLGDSTDEAASLLGIPATDLATALKQRTVTVRRETTIVQRTPAEAIEARDASRRYKPPTLDASIGLYNLKMKLHALKSGRRRVVY